MTKIMEVLSPSLADIVLHEKDITHQQIGIDTIRLTPVYKSVKKLLDKLDLKAVKPKRGSPVNTTITKVLSDVKKDLKRRYKASKFKPVVEVVKLSKGKSLSNYMIIILKSIHTATNISKLRPLTPIPNPKHKNPHFYYLRVLYYVEDRLQAELKT